MTTPLWAWELARAFWRQARIAERFPRPLREALTFAIPSLAIEELPDLSTRLVRDYLARREVLWQAGHEDRRLRGCLVARADAGWIFLDANDPGDEKLFSLAHELAHFLRHQQQPRARAADLGPGCLEVFDGQRKASDAERLVAALRGVRLAQHTHLMDRQGEFLLPGTRHVEFEADCLAIELLAPEEAVQARLDEDADRAQVEILLRDTFGLPASLASYQATRLLPDPEPTPFTDRLRKMLQSCRTSAACEESDGRR